MTQIYMLSRYVWTFRTTDGEHEVFESCESAVLALMARGIARSAIAIDYETETGGTRARETAKRFVKAYGKQGERFMIDGVLIGAECPPLPDGIEEQRALRKRPLVCPHCNKPIRMK